jgi:hypothetical protein
MHTFVRVLIGLAIVLVVFAIFSIVVFYRSSYSGVEFSPDDFSAREFSYFKEPTTGFVLRGRVFSDYSIGGLDLVADGLIKPKISSPQTWHLIRDNGDTPRHSRDSDARLLVDYLKLSSDRGENVWETWNVDHPNLAKEFWPVVAEMARDEMYLVVCDVMEFGLDTTITDIEKFKLERDLVVGNAYLKMAVVELELENYPRALMLAEKSIRFHPSDESNKLLTKINKQMAQ